MFLLDRFNILLIIRLRQVKVNIYRLLSAFLSIYTKNKTTVVN